MRGKSLKKLGKSFGVFVGIVFSAYKRVFKINPPARLFKIILRRLHDRKQRIFFRHGHKLYTLMLKRRVQGNGKIDGNSLVCKPDYLRDQAAG